MQFSITANSNQTSNEIHLVATLDGSVIEQWNAQKGTKTVVFNVDDTDNTVLRSISIEMSGKKDHHTILDEQGDIVSDHYVIIENITFDEIDVTDFYCNGTRCYKHNNGFVDEFYGFVGVNGTITIDFYTPLWKWFNSKCK